MRVTVPAEAFFGMQKKGSKLAVNDGLAVYTVTGTVTLAVHPLLSVAIAV